MMYHEDKLKELAKVKYGSIIRVSNAMNDAIEFRVTDVDRSRGDVIYVGNFTVWGLGREALQGSQDFAQDIILTWADVVVYNGYYDRVLHDLE